MTETLQSGKFTADLQNNDFYLINTPEKVFPVAMVEKDKITLLYHNEMSFSEFDFLATLIAECNLELNEVENPNL